ncbi:N-acetyl-gamma-glutamyl-phosphate reductase [Lysinibacillus alkalisoli]|uniref:N-acetyl-gamma-glutamyl-phosphate reductase n=1 Tax=Lysinibacillus alkalisoli TaxID=1911548 RepID=A0A917G966_9BACI|nr:N-acetyl-gamma-glutamyl-phosphate reductase [Lysinibacillus alkalisoli]GGG30018.1 N-acetyl-gamma-glutamyl-phosphate reductase [Lysinibacillus alkalisoli]
MKIGIIGATGYGGLELIRFLHNHKEMSELHLFTSSEEGVSFSHKFGHLTHIVDHTLQKIDDEQLAKLDVVFTSTPAGVASKIMPTLLHTGPKLIDLSGDFRLKDRQLYTQWYKKEAADEKALAQSVYGLSEWNANKIKVAPLIANPGCYPTATLLSVLPLIKEGLIDATQLIIDAKSGYSGAGNKPSQTTHFSEANEGFSIYKVNEHQHIPEIEQSIAQFTDVTTTITFNTHLVPMTRGILTTAYAPLVGSATEQSLVHCLQQVYANHPFVRVITDATTVNTARVKGSNYCDILVRVDQRTNRATIICAIDNLVKGAAGQAIQNMNIQFGLPETTGLDVVPLFI